MYSSINGQPRNYSMLPALKMRLKAMSSPGTGRSGWIRKASGWALLLAGIAGCILPVIPGIPLLLAGLLILAQDYAWAKGMLHRVKRWAVRARRKARERRAAAAARNVRTADTRKRVEES